MNQRDSVQSLRPGLFLVCMLFSAVWQPQLHAAAPLAHEKSFLWEVKSSTATVYLLGSIHFADSEIYPLHDAIEQAFERSSSLVVEFNPLTIDKEKLQRTIRDRGTYTGDKTLLGELSDPTLDLLTKHLEGAAIPLQEVQKLKPAILAMILTTTQLSKLGFSPEYGIEVYFSRKARNSMPIMELESLQEQMDLLFELPDQDMFLRYTLLELDKMGDLFKRLLRAWRTGDDQTMSELMLKPYVDKAEFKSIIARFFDDRNLAMTAKIEKLLQHNETYFVVVGAGHLVGEAGIVALLRQRAHVVRQL